MARSKWISFGAQQSLDQAAKRAGAAISTTTSPLTSSGDAKKFGFENFGNTCYANSVLQALYFCTPFRDLLLQDVDLSQPQDSTLPSGPSKSTSPLAPVRRKPERKASTSGHIAEPSSSTTQQTSMYPIPPSPPTLFSALQSLFLNISTNTGDKGTVSPRAFIDKLKELNDIFRSTMHQDAHEFLNYLLNRIVEEIEEEKKKQAQNGAIVEDLSNSVATLGSRTPPTILTANSSNSGAHPHEATLVHKLFEGVLTSETRCLTCETVSSRDESFLDLSIDIEQNSSVTACLRQFSASEMLCHRNKFFCDSCCDLQEAEKRMKIKKLPNVLALHLKRFKYQEDVAKYIKLAYRVAFPFELRLFNTVDDIDDADRLYNLFAIVVHIGNGPHHGHYISIIKTAGTWLVFDDDNVYPIPESDIPKYFGDSNSGSAYVLYYQAEDIDYVSLGLRSAEPTPPPEATISGSIPHTLQSPQSGRSPILPPGLNPVGTPDDAEHLHLPPSALPSMPSVTPQPSLEKPILAPVVTSITHNSEMSPPTGNTVPTTLTPITPAGFGTKLINTMRRAPSITATRGTIGHAGGSQANSNENRRSISERSPRASSSTPSFVTSLDMLPQEPPPPLPPLPTSVLPLTNTTPIIIPQVNEPEKEEKEKEKEKSKSPGGWFYRKRKSLRAGEKSRTDISPTRDMPSSPNPRADESSQSSSNWFKSSSSSNAPRPQRPSPENGSSATGLESSNAHLDSSKLRPPLVPLRRQDRSDEIAPPESASSSPSSTSLLSNSQPSGTSYTTRPSTSSTVSTSGTHPVDFPHSPGRKGTAPSTKPERPRPSTERKKSLDFNALSTSTPNSVSMTFTASQTANYQEQATTPPIPTTPRSDSYHRRNVSNGNIFGVEPPAPAAESSMKGKSRLTEAEGGGGGAGMGGIGQSPTPASQRTFPPVSIAASMGGGNLSSGSTNSTSSNIKRATRKLSLTAPMLGFGKRDKDKDKDKDKELDKIREREKERSSPNAFNRF